jgi:hypothetical protein
MHESSQPQMISCILINGNNHPYALTGSIYRETIRNLHRRPRKESATGFRSSAGMAPRLLCGIQESPGVLCREQANPGTVKNRLDTLQGLRNNRPLFCCPPAARITGNQHPQGENKSRCLKRADPVG